MSILCCLCIICLGSLMNFNQQIVPCDSYAVACNICLLKSFDVEEEPSNCGESLLMEVVEYLGTWSKYRFDEILCKGLQIVLRFVWEILHPTMIKRCHLRDIVLLTSNNVSSEDSIHFIDCYVRTRNKSIWFCKFDFAKDNVFRYIFWISKKYFDRSALSCFTSHNNLFINIFNKLVNS